DVNEAQARRKELLLVPTTWPIERAPFVDHQDVVIGLMWPDEGLTGQGHLAAIPEANRARLPLVVAWRSHPRRRQHLESRNRIGQTADPGIGSALKYRGIAGI